LLLVLESSGVVRRASLRDYAEAVYALLNLIPPGSVSSYGDIGALLGVSPRLVGYILSLNEDIVVTPCHRVVHSSGRLGGYRGPGGVLFKRRLLELEGVVFRGDRVHEGCFISLKRLLG